MINFDEHKPIYLQISDSICEKILIDDYAEDERIPSIREMGAQLGVNPNTVMRSYDHLKSLDIIYDKRGMGFFASPDAKKSVKKMYKKEFMGLEMLSIAKKINLLEISLDDFVESLKEVLEEQKK
jgi:GntR family transcriptional regulator